MSWFDRTRLALACVSLAGLAGCFQPLYSEGAHPGINEAMKEIEVVPIKERIGAYLADDLITNLNGTGETLKPKYRLTVTLTQSTQTPTISSQIGIASSVTLIENAEITLLNIDKGDLIFKGQAQSAAPYDRSFDSYANLRASRDAELRLARSLALEIESRVAAALAAKMNPGG